MQWSWYKRSLVEANLATFGEFMTELVNTASDVTLPVDSPSLQSKTSFQTGRDKQKLYVHAAACDEQATPKNTAEFSKFPIRLRE